MNVGLRQEADISLQRLPGSSRPEAVNRGHFRLGSFADHIDPERTLARYHTQEDEFWRAR